MKSQYKYLALLIFAVIAISYFTWAIFNSGKRLEKTTNWVSHTHLVINNIGKISTTITEIQSAFRGFLIVDSEIFGAEVNKKSLVLLQQLESTRQLNSNNAAQLKNIGKIKALSGELVDWQAAVILARSSNNHSSLGLRGKILMDSIKHYLTEMDVLEEELLQATILENKRVSEKRLFVTLAGGIFYMLFVVIIIFQLRRHIERRKLNERSILESEMKYRRLIEDSGVVMFTTSLTGDFTFVNNRIESLTGYKDHEIINKSYSMLVVPSYLSMVEAHYMHQFMNRTPDACIEFPIITKSGEEKWIAQDSVLVYDQGKIIGFQCIVKDIDVKKKAEAALQKIELERKEYEFRLQSVLDNTPLMIFIKDLQGKYLLVNKRFREAFGGESPIGKTDYDFDTIVDADRFRLADEKVIKTLQPLELEETITQNDNTLNLMVVKFPLFDQSGKIFAISGIATDITERVQYHKHLLDTRKMAETAEKLQGEFLANMSHEIRTPMNGIIGMTNLLLQTKIDADQERFLHIVRQSSDNLLFLINDILDLSKIKAGKMTIETIEFNIAGVMETVIAPFRIKMQEKGVELVTEIHPDIPEILIGDPYRLSQILSNLFSNALKFTHKGYIKFIVSMPPGDNDDGIVMFSVEDTGIGIAADKINYIFESFAQANIDTTRKFGGTGLGLSITKQLIELQDGNIHVTSILDQGTTFHFTIPYKKVHAKLVLKESDNQVVDKEALRGKKVLIVEDNEINQMVVSFTLKQAGMLTTIVNNGKEAIEYLQSEEDTNFDLIIMDLQMPEMDGFQASTYIRKVLMLKTPIIAMTASVLSDERIRCFNAGMNDYMSKPFKPAELFFTVSKFLNVKLNKNHENREQKRSLAATAPFDLDNLYMMMPKSQASEVLGLFVDCTPVLLNKIQTAVLLESWNEVIAHAQVLKSSIELLQLHEMMEDIIDIERMARLNVQLDMMPSIVNRLIENFNTIKPKLELEKTQMAIL